MPNLPYVANTQSLSQIIYKITNRDKYERKELRVASVCFEYELDDDDGAVTFAKLCVDLRERTGRAKKKEKKKKRNHRHTIE